MKILNFIDGKFCKGKKKQWLDNVCPSTGKVYSQVAASTKEDVEHAVLAADKAFASWKKTSLEERSALMLDLARLIKRDLAPLAQAESKDQGKPLELAREVDVPRSAKNLEFFATYTKQLEEKRFTGEMGDNCVRYGPLGVVATISPWNLPLYLLTWKIAPALICGNCVVAKPSELTPLTASMLGELIREAKFPPGVINIIHGKGEAMGDHLTTHPKVKAVSFTGSCAVGKHIYCLAAKSIKRVSLEMGGKNPNIVFADCDFDQAVKSTVQSAFSNQGEICTCTSRVFVEESLYEKFKEALLDSIASCKQGALVSEGHLAKVLSYVDQAQREGGKVICGGKRLERPGFYMAPTVIEGLGPHHQANQEEIFGPVITLSPFGTENEVIQWANGVDYGLSATIHTTDSQKAMRVAEQIDAGMIWTNDWMKRDLRTPFGGMKKSGHGREGGTWSLEFYSEVKNICFMGLEGK